MKWKISLLCALLLLALCTPPAGAVDLPGPEEKYIVVALDEYSTLKVAPITGTIRQGETRIYTYEVPTGKSKLEAHLEWTSGNVNDLTLKVHTPDNQNFGPYNDGLDALDDNKVRIGIIKNPLRDGEWRFEISGNQVSGTESFSLAINAT